MKRSPALLGWMAVAVVVLLYDTWALLLGKETLSAYFARISNKPVGRLIAHGTWLGLTWHLMHGNATLLPSQVHQHYRRWHPLWLLHDLAASRANRTKLAPVPRLGSA